MMQNSWPVLDWCKIQWIWFFHIWVDLPFPNLFQSLHLYELKMKLTPFKWKSLTNSRMLGQLSIILTLMKSRLRNDGLLHSNVCKLWIFIRGRHTRLVGGATVWGGQGINLHFGHTPTDHAVKSLLWEWLLFNFGNIYEIWGTYIYPPPSAFQDWQKFIVIFFSRVTALSLAFILMADNKHTSSGMLLTVKNLLKVRSFCKLLQKEFGKGLAYWKSNYRVASN